MSDPSDKAHMEYQAGYIKRLEAENDRLRKLWETANELNERSFRDRGITKEMVRHLARQALEGTSDDAVPELLQASWIPRRERARSLKGERIMMLNVKDALAVVEEVSEDLLSLSEAFEDEIHARLHNASNDLLAAAKVIETYLEGIRNG